ncbi:MAG TPA: hypothetical protein VLI04_06200, partial [Nocardioidaceae bacterium]|nr:hypothetical protein [Nocardioidaceae bacterium]
MRTTPLLALTVSSLILTACTSDPETNQPVEPVSSRHLDPALSMTPAGVELLASSDFSEGSPRIAITSSADPVTGAVRGKVVAQLPIGAENDVVTFRYFPALDSFKASATAGPAIVDGDSVDVEQDAALITVPLPAGHGDEVSVELPFAYTLPATELPSALDALTGTLEPAQIGLLGRYPDRLSLGHWYPIWVPPGMRADADPKGFGDISNFAAADLSLSLTVPEDWSVIDGGVPVEKSTTDGLTTVTSYGTGMRDLSVAVVKGYVSRSRTVDGVTLNAWGPESAADELDGVLDETEAAVTALSAAYTGYPWKEFDVVSTPLGGGVAGMEWPGATWIESAAFAGGFPGLGDLGELGELLGPLLGGGGLGEVIATTRPWTIAHEVAHIWWTILVGNDSIAAPVVDEPLAQYSACLVLRTTRDGADEICKAQIVSGFEGLSMSGDKDTKADQASDEFASAAQYGGVVYGKAAWFYIVLEREFGKEKVRAALRDVVLERAFETATGPDL